MRISTRRIRDAILATLAACLAAAPAAAGTATIAVAANFKPAMDELEAEFEKASGHRLAVAAGSTGKFYAQIVNGAPFDIFLAADQVRPRMLVATGRAEAASLFSYARGGLVLWAPTAEKISAGDLKSPRVRRIAVANPELAPYGAAAMEILERLDLAEEIRPKLVYGENIGQTFAFVDTGAAEAGFVALSQLRAAPDRTRGARWTPPPGLYRPILQDAVLLTRAKDNAAAREFMIFLRSDEAREIIRRAGYDVE